MYWNGPESKTPEHKMYEESNSMEGQESWVLNAFSEKRNGCYVEIGSGHPEIGNNTYLLEKQFGWSGVGFELDSEMVKTYNSVRVNKCLNEDAITADYRRIFKENEFPKQIDYLQIDVDNQPFAANLLALIALPLAEYRFSIMTIEHGVVSDYRNEELRSCQRTILSSFGYRLIVQGINEDWWVDGNVIPYEKYGYMFAMGRPWFARPTK
jgi:hypothetical protein